MEIASHPENQNWITFTEPSGHFKVSFPHQPVHMHFDLTKEDHLSGYLEVYSAAINQGVFMVNIISSPSFKEKDDLSKEFFHSIFYSCCIRRLFYYPKRFKDLNSFKIEQTNIQGYRALNFMTHHSNEPKKEKLSGIAILKNDRLFIIFSIASENKGLHPSFDSFIPSFQLYGESPPH
jgi:hypothetical protein